MTSADDSEYMDGGWRSPRVFISLLEKAAERAEVDVRWLSDHWIARLSRDGLTYFVYGTSFPLNNMGAAYAATDKVATYTILSDCGIPAVAHHLARFSATREVAGAADRALASVRFPAVVKPLDEASGKDVYRVDSESEAKEVIGRLAQRYAALAISRFEEILVEYRVVILDGRPLLVFRKEPAADEWRHNLKYGARPVIERSEVVRTELAELALKAIRAVGGRFMTVDIIRTPDALMVIEINSGVMLDRFARASTEHREMAVRIYEQALTSLFA